VTLQQLRYLVAVARCSSFTRAALELHVAQPSLSQQIRALEDEVGAPLLDRSDRAVHPTALGRRVLGHAMAAIEASESIAREASLARGIRRLRVGAVHGAGRVFWPKVLPEFIRAHPHLRLEVHESGSLEIRERVLAGDLDLALAAEAPDEDGGHLSSRPLLEGHLVVCTEAASDLAARSCVRPADCRNRPLIMLGRRHLLTRVIRRMAEALSPSDEICVDSVEAAWALVAAGVGISILPDLVVRGADREANRVRHLPLLAPEALRWSWVLLHRDGRRLSEDEAEMIDAIVRASRSVIG
jgi:DNA-binding transcriptional LysR family regulator